MKRKGIYTALLKDRGSIFSAGALALILVLAYGDWREYQVANEAVRQTVETLLNINTVLSLMKDAETGQRGFLLTGAERYLQPYENARREVPQQLTVLRTLLANDSALQSSLGDLDRSIDEKVAELRETINLRRENRTAAAIAIVNTDRGKQAMDSIRTICSQMQESVQQKLAERRGAVNSQTRRARLLSTGASCLLFTMVALATLKFRKEKQAAEAANHAKSAFLANMSHELRTPLNAILGYSEMLLEEAEDTNQTALVPDVQKIKTAGKHLLELINAVLDLSKIEAGKMELYLETFSIPKLVEEVVNVIQPLAAKNGNSITSSIEPSVDLMKADQTKVRQSLYNLLSNACKFTSKGSITIDVRLVSNDNIAFNIADTGVGMTKEQAGRLFEPFTQADTSTSRKFGGTGLGLAISRRFAKMMDGDITLDTVEGKGSRFTLTLPRIAKTSQGEERENVQLKTQGSGAAGTILIVDDDPNVHELLGRSLAKYGFDVKSAFTGEDGLRLARKLRPQAITLDVMMPGMDGWTVLSSLKSDQDLADIPIIMLTIVDNKNLGYSLGAADYLTKPIDRERLSSVLFRYRGNAGNTVLIVEDDANSREVLRRLLEKEGWLVSEADNGIRALEQLAQSRPSVVLLDLMMPEMDGFEFLSQMHRNQEWKSIPVIVITAKDLTDEDRRRLNGQVSRVLQKGQYRREELLEQVSSLVVARLRKKLTT